jgi:hypothetical protein
VRVSAQSISFGTGSNNSNYFNPQPHEQISLDRLLAQVIGNLGFVGQVYPVREWRYGERKRGFIVGITDGKVARRRPAAKSLRGVLSPHKNIAI